VARKEFLLRSSSGIDHFLRHEGDGSIHLESHQDAEPFLDVNKAQYTHNDGYTPDRTMRRAASIPSILVYKWLVEEGWNAADPDNWDKLKEKLNSSEYLYLRTAPGRL
jgi:hypothetical protein